jgi:UDP-N-acetylmuramate dehydrogenase
MPTATDKLKRELGPGLRTAAPLAPLTWMRVGGPAEMLMEATTAAQLTAARRACRRLGVPFCLLGDGSNVVAPDSGLPGLVVVNRIDTITWDRSRKAVTVGSGFSLDRLVAEVSQIGWDGIVFAAGIPGSIGGGLVGGAGAYGHLLGERLHRARVLAADGRLVDTDAAGLGIRYRNSDALLRGDIVLAATFAGFTAADPQELSDRIQTIKADRRRKHPPGDLPCAGSFFKNLPPPKPGAHRVPAGRLLDECGAKQMREGGAEVFHKHANIIVNTGTATAADIDRLADRMADRVRRRLGVQLVREVRTLASSRNPGAHTAEGAQGA